MSKYSYVGTKNKKIVKGEIEAVDKADAESKLREDGIEPTRVFLPLEYDHIQFISYQVNTFPKETKRPGMAKLIVDGKKHVVLTTEIDHEYLGKEDFTEDINNRIELVEQAIEAAAARAEISTDENCLKLFMLPEFYFRGSKGAYSLDDYQTVIKKLRELVNKDKWKHWLFVFGTVLAVFEPLSIETEGSRGKMKNKKAILNAVLVQKGAAGEEKSSVIVKDVMSDIDFSRQKFVQYKTISGKKCKIVKNKKAAPEHLWDENVDHLRAGKKKGWWIFKKWDANQKAGKENQVANFSGLGIFEMEKITFGLEVCLDHALQRLRKSPPPKGSNWIQVQLIPSAGMEPMEESIVACTGGWVFNCDGNAITKVHEVESEWQGENDATLWAEEAAAAEWEIHTADPGLKKFKESFQGKAHLLIFPPQALPVAKAVS